LGAQAPSAKSVSQASSVQARPQASAGGARSRPTSNAAAGGAQAQSTEAAVANMAVSDYELWHVASFLGLTNTHSCTQVSAYSNATPEQKRAAQQAAVDAYGSLTPEQKAQAASAAMSGASSAMSGAGSVAAQTDLFGGSARSVRGRQNPSRAADVTNRCRRRAAKLLLPLALPPPPPMTFIALSDFLITNHRV